MEGLLGLERFEDLGVKDFQAGAGGVGGVRGSELLLRALCA